MSAAGLRLLLGLSLVIGTPPAVAAESDETPSVESIEARSAQIAERLAETQAGEAPSAEEVGLLGRLQLVLAGQLDALARAEELRKAAAEVAAHAADPPASRIAAEPPYSVPDLDAATSSLDEEVRRGRELERAQTAAQDALEQTREELERAERARRAAQEAFDTAEEADLARLAGALKLRELETEVLRDQLELRRLELANARVALENQEEREAQQRDAVAWLVERVAPDPADLRATLHELDKREFDLERKLESAKLDLRAAEERWSSAQRRAKPDAGERERVRALRLAYTNAQQRVGVLGDELERARHAREVWRRRYAAIADEASYEEIVGWKEEVVAWIEESERDAEQTRSRLAELRDELAEARVRLGEAPPTATAEARWIAEQADLLERLASLLEDELTALDSARGLRQRLLADLERRVGGFDFRGHWTSAVSGVRALWGYELTASEDRPITIGKVVSALLIFALGYVLARLAAGALGRRLLPHFHVEEGVVHSYQALLQYALLVVAFLVALRMVNIPLTAFAVAGGALAIGVGFGSQNIVNNFISGLILLAERPIKLGDLIDVDGTYGTVERIGLRSTRVRSGQNVHIIVPNSAFLENRVVNWTHNNPIVRIPVKLGVAYGSPTQEVQAILERVASDHPRVHASPSPLVLFTDFGDNALQFELHVWIRMKSLMDRLMLESELRFAIDAEFRKAGIVIAFPQRDLHVKTPVEVRLAAGSPESM